MKYLTPELKTYYMKDFNENVLTCTDPYWKLDEGLKEILIAINKFPNIQTLYSKKCNELIGENPISYLILAVHKRQAFKLITVFDKIKTQETNLIITQPNNMYAPDIKQIPNAKHLACLADKDFFNITQFRFDLIVPDLEEHENFWKELTKYLVNSNF